MSGTEPEPARELSVADMRKVMASILDVLECPVCYQELYSPIYQCNNGHPVCSNCRPRVRACPVCKSWMYHVRALTLEKIVREMPRPCRYTSIGCTERLGTASRAQHERCCPRRPARCVEALVPCGWKGPLTEARAHLWADHELAGRLHRAMHGRFSFSVGCVGQEKFLEDRAESVLFRCLIRAERGRLHFLCHALVAADRAGRYVFRVLVTNRCSERRLSYEGPVPSVFQSVAKTIEASQGLRVGRDWLLRACSCRAGELCFDTTWQLSRRAELAQAERDLRTILAGAYPEPHGGSHDRASSVTGCGRRSAAGTFTPSGGRQEVLSATTSSNRQQTPSVAPSSNRQQTPNVNPPGSWAGFLSTSPEQTPFASPHAGRQEPQVDGRGESAAISSSRRERSADTHEQLPNSDPPECRDDPAASTSTPEGRSGSSANTVEGKSGTGLPDGSQSAAAAQHPVTSGVSAACYAAAVSRLAMAITSSLTVASRDTETRASPAETAAACQPDAVSETAVSQPGAAPETLSVQLEVAAAHPGAASNQPELGADPAEVDADT